MPNEQLHQQPRLRSGEKVAPPYALGKFPHGFATAIGKQVIYTTMTKPTPTIEGQEWELMFAHAVGAEWSPSNLGLDDVRLGNCAWGAKTVKNRDPWRATSVRLISGRNSLLYSYHKTVDPQVDRAEMLADHILGIWNTRVDLVRQRYPLLRKVVLVKSEDLRRLAIFETETIRYDRTNYDWKWNSRNNVEGWEGSRHRFTWQPHGSQFTIIEDVPESRVCLELTLGRQVDPEQLLKASGFEESWVRVVIPDEENSLDK